MQDEAMSIHCGCATGNVTWAFYAI